MLWYNRDYIFLKIHLFSIYVVFFSALLLWSSSSLAAQVLQILPTRIVLEKQNWTTVTLINRGVEAADYRILLRNLRTNERGEYLQVEELQEGEMFADKMIRFSPRRVTVPPRSKQDVRVMVRKTRDLADGEYRTHMVFRGLPKQNKTRQDENDNSISFETTVEISIPVLVRHGKVQAKASLSDIKILTTKDEPQKLSVSINREGNRSLYGDLEFWWSKNAGEKKRIAFVKGVAVYVPNKNRVITLLVDEGVTIEDGQITVKFFEDTSYGGDSTAEASSSL